MRRLRDSLQPKTISKLSRFATTHPCSMQALASLDRLDNYLWSQELEEGSVVKLPFEASRPAVKMERASFNWDPEANIPTLTDINLQIPHGALVTVVGKVGSGKSSLLASILGEMPKLSGKVSYINNIYLLTYYFGPGSFTSVDEVCAGLIH